MGQPGSTGLSTPLIGGETVGGSISGVSASKGALTAVGVNSLIVDPQVQSAMLTSGLSVMGMGASSVLGPVPASIDSQTMFNALGNIATDLESFSNITNAYSSDVSNGSSSDTTASSSTTSASSSTTSASSSTESMPSSDSACSLTQIMDEMASLSNQQSETMAQQQASQIDAISLQAQDTMNQGNQMMKGASMMMEMAVVGLSVNVATATYSAGSAAGASKAGDDAETASMSENEINLNKNAADASTKTDTALQHKDDQGAQVAARNSIGETKNSADEKYANGKISESQKNSIHDEMDANSEALNKNDVGDNNNATASRANAKQASTDRANSGTSIAQLSKQGIKPGTNISDQKAKASIQSGWSDSDKAEYAQANRNNNKPEQDRMLNTPATTLQKDVAGLKTNENSSVWTGAYQSKIQQTQIYAGLGTAFAQTINAVGTMEDQVHQAKAIQDSAGATVEGAAVQAMAQGITQTQQLAEQIRSNQNAVAQDMSSMVSSTKV